MERERVERDLASLRRFRRFHKPRLESVWLDCLASSSNTFIKPEAPSVCQTCRYRSSSPHLLLCAVHPTGPDGKSCPDWETESDRARSQHCTVAYSSVR